MVLLDSAILRTSATGRRPSMPLVIALMALVVGLAGLAFGLDQNRLGFATQLVWRFNCLVFFAALVAGPLGRLIPLLHVLADKGRPLLQGFCAAMGVYFAFILLPNLFAVPDGVRPAGITAGTTMFVLFTGSVTLVMAAAVHGGFCDKVGPRACRTMLGVAVIYFWLCYSLIGLAHISGPHRPDLFYELSLILMLSGLFVRFADRFFAGRNPIQAA
jgi:hypothetical protein